MCAISTASVGAPSARAMMVDSPTAFAVSVSISGVNTKPHYVTVCATASGVVPSTAADAFIAK